MNLDAGFLDTTNVMNPEVPVYAIVNSIVDGSAISRVQILIDGKTDITYMGKINLEKTSFQKSQYCGRRVACEKQTAS